MSLVSDRTQKIDLVLMEAHMPDINFLRLLDEAIGREIPTIVMSDDNEFAAAVAIAACDHGACFFYQKPITGEIAESHVMKQKMTNNKNTQGTFEHTNLEVNLEVSSEVSCEQKSEHENETDYESSEDESDKDVAISEDKSGKVTRKKKKSYMKWTDELHKKFMAAVSQLGNIYDCNPMDVVNLMNEPGISRLQVASHLQKCRRGLWRTSSKKRKNLSQFPPSQENQVAPQTSRNNCPFGFDLDFPE